MNLLKFAVEKQRWDLAAYAIVLATVRVLSKGVPDGGKRRKKRRTEG
ncbi:MAG TPA: hypothetical protein VJ377_00410 [Dehalococcoidales bacterium]|nr:hypothetical protein [Dehalococcoidales bacterium]